MVTVRNTNNFPIRDKCAGVEYEFPVNKEVAVPEQVAAHIFGYGQDDNGKFRAAARNGWNFHKSGDWRGVLAKVIIKSEAADDAQRLHSGHATAAA